MQATTFSTYPIFEADQVLTSKHLNDLVNYLEEQERHTRNRLIGIGIACGLDLSLSADKTTVSIMPGVGVTSEGYLVAFHGQKYGETAHYSFFRPYTFGDRGPYNFFKKGEGAIDLYELHEQKVEGAEPFTEVEGGIEDYVVILFLDCLDKKLKNCVENDCNEKGTERSFTLRPLLVRRNDARDIICREEELNVPKTEAEIDAYVNARFRLPPLEIPRFRLNNNQLDHFNDLYVRYDNIIEGYMPVLQSTLQTAYARFKPLLRKSFGTANPFQNNGSTNLKAKYDVVKSKSPFAVQYFYDMLRDLTDVYNEFREVVFDLMCECCPAPGRFPKHLRLGHLATVSTCEPSPYRTRFIYAPILNDQSDLKGQVLSLFRKMTLLPAKFILPSVEQIKITPGRTMQEPLSRRTIPYFYNILNEGVLLKNWDADRKKKCRYNENLSYHSNRYAGTIPHILNPLQYDHDQYDFLRIEGHLGVNYRKALSTILSIRNQQNLPFDIIALSMSEDASGTTIDFSECHFRDLEIMCQAWRKELECMLGEVVKGLSKVKVGQTLKRATSFRDATPPSFLRTSFSRSSETITAVNLSANIADNVKDSIEVEDDTFGVVLHEAVKTAEVGGGDYYVRAETLLLQDQSIRDLSRDEFEVAFSAPMLVASRAVAFAEKVSDTCDALDMKKLEAGMKELVKAATRYQILLTNYQTTEASNVQINVLQMIRLMSILIGRCTLEQLKIIKEEMERRKEQLRKRNLFSEYVAKNPGIEHHGGVPKGGTFIMVYHDISRQDTITHQGPFTLRGRVVDQKGQPLIGATVGVLGTTLGTITDFNGFFSLRVEQLPVTLVARLIGIADIELEVTDPKQTILLQPGNDGGSEVFPAPQRFTVFADFYVPYLCCSDCPPIDYVILPPEGKEALELVPKSYCMPVEEDFPGAMFSVYPARGIVAGPGVSGDVSSGFVFNPSQIDMGDKDELEVINFKVNGEDVPLTIMLYKKPVAAFKAGIEPIDATSDGMVGKLFLENESSENAVKFMWEIQRVLIDGKVVENHIFETEDREPVSLDIIVKRGEDFVVRLTAFSKHCDSQTEQVVQVDIPKREVNLNLFDPSGNKLATTTINRSTDGAFTLLAEPGEGNLGPEEVIKKLKIEIGAVRPESNKYLFNAKNGNGTFELKYSLPEGTSKTISLTFKGGGGGGGNFGFNRPINPGGGVIFDPGIFTGTSRTVPEAVKKVMEAHVASLKAVRANDLFRTVLGPSSDAFRVSTVLAEELIERLSNASSLETLATGKFNPDFSEKMNVALKDTTKRLAAATNEKARILIGRLLNLQLEQIVSMVILQGEDLSSRDPLSKQVTKAIAEVKKLQSRDVKVDKGKKLSKSLTSLTKEIKNKPKIKERIDVLIAQVKKG